VVGSELPADIDSRERINKIGSAAFNAPTLINAVTEQVKISSSAVLRDFGNIDDFWIPRLGADRAAAAYSRLKYPRDSSPNHQCAPL